MAEAECELLETHRKERKELQCKIQELKHGISKGDKKKKKQVLVDIALMEAELTAKHEKELEEFATAPTNGEVENCEEVEKSSVAPTEQKHRISKAQKRRTKKLDKVREREEAIQQQEIDNLTGARNIEAEKLNSILSSRGLATHEVPSDGDCLYKAVEHQLSVANLHNSAVKELRQKVSAHMLSHVENYMPFLTDPSTGDVMTEDQYTTYCEDIAKKPTWGGQVEIQALSEICGVAIEVIQAEGPSIVTGENGSPMKLILSYHRHMYGLGEHYNSVVEKLEEVEDF